MYKKRESPDIPLSKADALRKEVEELEGKKAKQERDIEKNGRTITNLQAAIGRLKGEIAELQKTKKALEKDKGKQEPSHSEPPDWCTSGWEF
ncbi:Uncharacterised protein [Candidatus Burarchaeum australiense]|nr:Uncharacterised protein [Candidatus Burarchaeum australiense]